MSYSVGQVFINTISGSNGFSFQGVQQPYEISVLTELKEAAGINLMASVYPNPVSDNLTIAIKDIELSCLSYQIFDLYGNLLRKEEISSPTTEISMSNFFPAVYFLKVSLNNIEVKTFKIIKK
jgi:hypothetical protein